MFRIDSKIDFQFLRGGIGRKPKEAVGKVDDITVGSTTESEEVVFIQLHAGVPVLVEWAAGHAVWQYPQPIVFGSLPRCDSCLDGFKYAHYLASIKILGRKIPAGVGRHLTSSLWLWGNFQKTG